ncbi:NADPH:quinone reductase [Raineyella antarctica]|uniref:NADPH:quinone reductase n=1 Tax=Raineyella antarctica TaxID=1577474 RepID=A0A1G6HGQ0_9ACTN|nr:NADPH:quinone reductase [Raineyella antarctica]SDB93507.1 NADPH:quinone reductase [Raineyella antarctica]
MDVPTRMQAAFVRTLGGPELIEVGPLDVPRPGPTDVLVRLEASEVNHVDLLVRSGAYRTPTPFPFVIGRDLVGTVVATGPGVTAFGIGDRVWSNSMGHGGRQGTFAEYSVVAQDRLYPLPPGVDPMVAAAVLHTAATASIGLFRRARLEPGQTLFVGHASGGVGTALVQLAAAAGARVVATASPRDAAWCRDNGADVVLDHGAPDLVTRVGHAAPEGIDIWWDTSGLPDVETVLPLVRVGGSVVVTAAMAARPALPVGALYTRDLTLHGFAMSNATVEDLAAAAQVINHFLATATLRGRVAAALPLAQAARAHRMLQDGGVHGRLLLTP